MNINNDDYKRYVNAHAKKSPILKNCVKAFCIGGSICAFAQLLNGIYSKYTELPAENVGLLVSVTLIFLSVFLTSIGVFRKIAKHAGAGTLVPITGFANAVASSALDSKSEGLVLGVGSKIFTVAGPVLLYGTLAGAIYGIIYYVCGLLP